MSSQGETLTGKGVPIVDRGARIHCNGRRVVTAALLWYLRLWELASRDMRRGMTAGSKFQSFDAAFEECGCCEVAFSDHQGLLILDHRCTREVWLLIQRKVYLNLPPTRIRGEKPCLTRAVVDWCVSKPKSSWLPREGEGLSMNFENRERETLREIGMPSFLPSYNTGPMTSGPFTPVSERLSSASLPRHRALGWALVTG